MKKLLILALASAVAAASNADVVSSWGATSSGPRSATWTNAPSVESGVLKVDADVGDMAVLTPSGTAPAPQVKTVVTVVAQFDTINDVNELAEPGEGAKTAFTVANVSGTPRYFYWDGSDWASLDDTVEAETAITIKIELDNSTPNTTKAAFKVGDTQIGQTVTISSGTETTLSALAFAGTGTLTSVDATVTPAYAAKTVNNVTTRYATIADAGEGDITLYKHNGAFGELPTANDKVYYVKNASGTTADLGVFPSSGAGTAASPYTIGSVEELKAFKELAEKNYASTSFYKLTADINAENIDPWDGIGVYDNSNKAFKGTLDGAGYAINNLTFAAGKYRGFFDQLEGAVSNLTINVAGFADTTETEHGYAAFAGNMKGATIKNCIATGTIGTTSKPAMHTCGGFAVKVTSGGIFENCTNKIDIVCSLTDNPKIGGIVGLLQGATIKDCWNEGDMTITVKTCNQAGNGAGGLIGFAQTNASTITGGGNSGTIQATDTTTASSTTYPTYVGTIVGKTNTGLTVSGGTVAQADKASAGVNTNVSGLNFATVDGNVATFVADDALAADTTYKVMAAGATATATLTAGDTISFDENLFTPTYAITAASGVVAPSTSGKVTTYTASTPVPVDGGSTDETLLVSVPQNCKASQLIDTSNRASKDLLRVLNKATKKYYQWEYDGNGGWTPNNVATTDGLDETPAANTVDLTRGEAVWVTRTDTSKPIKLNAVYTDDPVEVAVSSGYNLVAPALKENVTTFALSSLAVTNGSFSDTDMIVIPGAAAPINCVRKDGAWKIYKAKSVTDDNSWGGIATGGTYVTPDPLPAGKGFFFVTKEAKTLSL